MSATSIRERPILMSGPMVQAILAGRKWQTRRVAKLPCDDSHEVCRVVDPTDGREFWRFSLSDGGATQCHDVLCPHGQPGDRLWVRETWAKPKPGFMGRDHDGSPIYRADYPPSTPTGFGPWKPSIHMPRWASRLTLEITEVRVERLRDITADDAIAEGIHDGRYDSGLGDGGKPGWCYGPGRYAGTPRHAFELLWDQINGGRPGCSWTDSPWVWALTFRRTDEEDAR